MTLNSEKYYTLYQPTNIRLPTGRRVNVKPTALILEFNYRDTPGGKITLITSPQKHIEPSDCPNKTQLTRLTVTISKPYSIYYSCQTKTCIILKNMGSITHVPIFEIDIFVQLHIGTRFVQKYETLTKYTY